MAGLVCAFRREMMANYDLALAGRIAEARESWSSMLCAARRRRCARRAWSSTARRMSGAPRRGDGGKITVGDYLAWWLDNEARHNVSPKTLQVYRYIVEKHVIPSLGACQLAKLCPLPI